MALGDKLPVVMGREKAAPEGVATLDADGILTEAQRPSLWQIKGGSNPNLLLNWDFRNPVNRNGKIEYNTGPASGYYWIDRWLLTNGAAGTLTSDGASLQYSGGSEVGNYILMQFLENFQQLRGKTMTLSLLTSEVTGSSFAIGAQFQSNYAGNVYSVSTSRPGLLSITFTVPQDAALLAVFVTSRVKQAVTLKCVAAKLELGPVQTLARQNADGEWEIIDPPDYGLQYALCFQYSPITGEWIGSQHSNPNLLDNWYFVGGGSQQGGGQFPINQRGKTEYTGIGYSIDRWGLNVNRGKITVSDDCITLTNTADSGAEYLRQGFEHEFRTGDILTLSFLIRGNAQGQVFFGSQESGANIGARTKAFTANAEWQLVSVTVTLGSTLPGWAVIQITGKNSYIDILAAKLELGPVQTLAHKEGDTWVLNDPPPNYQQELAKCQRYQFAPSPAGYVNLRCAHIGKNTIYFNLDTPVTMRAAPTILNTEDLNLFRYGNTSSNSEDGFTYTTLLHNNSIRINANKESHGITDAILGVYKTCIFDANL